MRRTEDQVRSLCTRLQAAKEDRDHEREADPAHPPAVQGRDNGRAQGVTAGQSLSGKTGANDRSLNGQGNPNVNCR